MAASHPLSNHRLHFSSHFLGVTLCKMHHNAYEKRAQHIAEQGLHAEFKGRSLQILWRGLPVACWQWHIGLGEQCGPR